jgi:serine/threonine-protein kinase OSR1/STK39
MKPGNILVNEKGEVKIADSGIAVSLLEQGQRKRARYTVIGTPCYMAPEVPSANHGYSEKADIWSRVAGNTELQRFYPSYASPSADYNRPHPVKTVITR